MAAAATTPHVLLFSYPFLGHVHPMLKLAELISNSGNDIYVTFLNTEHVHSRAIRSSAAFEFLSQRPMFRFRAIPDGLPENDPRPANQFLELQESLKGRDSREKYREQLGELDGWPPVSCVIADGTLRLAFEVAVEMEIPVTIFRTSSGCSLWAYYSIPELIERGELPLTGKEADMDKLVQGVRGMEGFLRRRDLPGLMRNAKDANDALLQMLAAISDNIPRARALILNTAEHLEADVLSYIRSVCPITYTVGPLQLLQATLGKQISGRVSLWNEDRSCMKWLDSQPDKSVVYVSFGSITTVSRETLDEFWHGLTNSGRPFLWVIRPDMLQEGLDTQDSVRSATEKGFVVEWAPQEEVLAHRATGCFLTHSGWNSTLESIVAGVPMICWPFFADQQMNSRFVSEVWKIGVDMKDMGGRNVVEEMVRRVMDGEEGKMLRENVMKMAETVKLSTEEGGSSYKNFQKLVQHITLK